MKNRKLLILMYSIIIIFEIIGFNYSLLFEKVNILLYYTELSNILLLITSIIELYFLIDKKTKKPIWFNNLMYTSIVSTTITFLVVLFILAPALNFNYKLLLFNGSMLFHHLLCPLLGLILFIFFDNYKYKKKDVYSSLIFTLIYAVIFITLNILKVIEGPYFFLMIYRNGLLLSIMWLIIVFGFSFLISKSIYLIKNKLLTKNKKDL